tara:strand:+ start:39 stop:212 length:174 start_codon:yes stop_codon:yes gene_type:complete
VLWEFGKRAAWSVDGVSRLDTWERLGFGVYTLSFLPGVGLGMGMGRYHYYHYEEPEE